MNIVLKSVGNNKVKVINTIREVTGLGLKEAKDIVDGVEAGNEYTITDIRETDAQAVMQQLTQIGAVVTANEDGMSSLTEDVKQLDSTMFCKKCGTELKAGTKFCGKCGAAVEVNNSFNDEVYNSNEELNKESKSEKAINKLIDKFAEFLERFIEWHIKSYDKNKDLTIVLIIAEVAAAIFILIKAWAVLLFILFIASIVLPFIMKHDFSDKDRQNSKEIIIGFAKMIAALIIITVIVLNWNSIISIVSPGALVRNLYFTSYSDEITIGEAFENVFTDCKWSRYTYNGNKYVRFTGKFTDDNGNDSIYQFNFLVLGDSATIDSVYLNGVDVSGMETLILVGIYNRNGVSW